MWACWPVWAVLLPQKHRWSEKRGRVPGEISVLRWSGNFSSPPQHLDYDRYELKSMYFKPGRWWWFKSPQIWLIYSLLDCSWKLVIIDLSVPGALNLGRRVRQAHISHSVIFSSQAWSCWPSACGGRWVWSPISLWRQRKAPMRHMFSSGPGPPSSSLACLAASPHAVAARGCSNWSVLLLSRDVL